MTKKTCALLIILLSTNNAIADVPTQWIAKLYSEVLGRSPDTNGWNHYINIHFSENTCNAPRLRGIAYGFLTSDEFINKNYSYEDKVLILHRSVYSMEPLLGNYLRDLKNLNSGTSWSQLVTDTLNVAFTESNSRTVTLCNNVLEGWGTNPVIQPPTTRNNYFSGGTSSELQKLLDNALPGSTVFLEERAVVLVNEPIIIPENIHLTTIGNPSADHYAKMARLIRNTNSNTAMIIPLSGSTLSSIWVDGQWDRYTPDGLKLNIHVRRYNGTNTSDNITISNNRVSNSSGGANISSWGSAELNPCKNLSILNNLITSYSAEHYSGGVYTDGIRVACEDTYVTGNHIIDATDVGIVVFRSGNATQQSIIYANSIVNAGNSAYGGIVIDQLSNFDSNAKFNFSGTDISYNKVWSSRSSHFGVILSVGTKPWFGSNTDYGTSASVHHNTTAGIRTNTNMGISVSRFSDSYIQSNELLIDAQLFNEGCPVGNIVIDEVTDLDIQGGVTASNIFNCMGHQEIK
ncbi:hypothetical protein ACJJIC_05400 [Microbulbifer sp. ANSA002]|uniref:hypothetical protein n=1 Tax=unclassified Microbulbifer TaxID=2619833 RepID=UPI00404347E6